MFVYFSRALTLSSKDVFEEFVLNSPNACVKASIALKCVPTSSSDSLSIPLSL